MYNRYKFNKYSQYKSLEYYTNHTYSLKSVRERERKSDVENVWKCVSIFYVRF